MNKYVMINPVKRPQMAEASIQYDNKDHNAYDNLKKYEETLMNFSNIKTRLIINE